MSKTVDALAAEYGWTVEEIFNCSSDEIDILAGRINDRHKRMAGGSGKGSNKTRTLDMRDERNLIGLEMMMPGTVDFKN